jgi:membrane-bound lytic murein transglycosylase A
VGGSRPVRRLKAWGSLLSAIFLAACATAGDETLAVITPPPPPAAPPKSSPVRSAPLDAVPRAEPGPGFAVLPGWDQEDHAAALDMFRASCGIEKAPVWREACLRARDLGPQDELISRAFWESNFRVVAAGADGLLTAYFAPEYPARAYREYPFTAPVRPRPAILPTVDVGANGGTAPWLDRAAIEAATEAQPLAWMKPEDLFFLQIQGSGVLDFPEGRRMKAVYAANNGQPFVGIATPMRQRGLLAADNTSGEAIRGWLADHRGPDADEIMQLDPRYVFFTVQPWDGKEPTGAAGVILTPGRSLAMDPSRHDYGALYWIVGEAPALNGAFPSYRRLAMALDTGSAIKGDVRADLYLGAGAAAGLEAGRVKHHLKLYRLEPVADPTLAVR